jgi:hypothetical protein
VASLGGQRAFRIQGLDVRYSPTLSYARAAPA